MQKTTFKIAKMDCPSEEQMIRMKLDGLSNIQSLDFDIPNRQLYVYHTDNYEPIFQQLDKLKFDTSLVGSIEVAPFIKSDTSQQERRLLWQVLSINFFFFVTELATGFFSHSMGLVADSFDMLADSIVYGLALWAVGKASSSKQKIARIAGYFQLILAVWGFIEVIRRFISFDSTPEFKTMIIISVMALIGNALCLHLLQKSKSNEAHMQASMIFTSNDVIVNLGVIIAGVLVYWTDSKYPDLLVGFAVFLLVGQGAIKILNLSKNDK